jgi:hypothetical protein
MDLNKVYKALYLYHVEGYSNINKIADETGLYPKLINMLIKGEAYGSVVSDFMSDKKAEDFTRVYNLVKPVKLSKIEYLDVLSNYLQKLLSGRATMRDIRGYLTEDDIYEPQARKMLKELEKAYNSKIEEVLDDKLFNILEVLRKPIKWSIDKDGNIIEIFPHPVLNKQNEVIGIEYKKERAYLLPDELFDRYCSLQDDIEREDKKGLNAQPRSYKDEWRSS